MDFNGDGAKFRLWLGGCIEIKFGLDCMECNYGILQWQEMERLIENIFIKLSDMLSTSIINDLLLAILY